jgi:ubiquinone/menaquinone biosynthesis C-methylase UbiE
MGPDQANYLLYLHNKKRVEISDIVMNQERYWDDVADEKEFTTQFQISSFEKHVSKESKILDVGCGYGRTLNELHNCGFKNLIGVDFSQRMIDRGKNLYPHLVMEKSNGKLPFDDDTFEAVLLLAVLTCIIEDEDQKKLINEIQRVLKDNGIFYINDFMINEDQRNIKRYDKYKDTYDKYGVFELPEGAVVRHHTKDHIFEITKDFHGIEFETVSYITMNGNKSNGFYYIGKKKQA